MHETGQEQYVALLLKHQARIRGFIRAMIPDRAAADDVAQETNMVLLRKSQQYDAGADFTSWALSIARYQVMAWRQKQGRDRLIFDETLLNDIADMVQQRMAEWDTRRAALRDCLDQLPPAMRQLLAARYQPNATPAELARETGRSVGSIRQTLYRIRAAVGDCVRRKLSEEARS